MKNLFQLIMISLAMVVSSCRTTGLITEADSIHDTTFITQFKHDSVYVMDSVWCYELIKGDTVIKTTDRWRVEYRDKTVHDSIYLHRVDSVDKVVVKEKGGKNSTIMGLWQGLLIGLLGGVIASLLMRYYLGK